MKVNHEKREYFIAFCCCWCVHSRRKVFFSFLNFFHTRLWFQLVKSFFMFWKKTRFSEHKKYMYLFFSFCEQKNIAFFLQNFSSVEMNSCQIPGARFFSFRKKYNICYLWCFLRLPFLLIYSHLFRYTLIMSMIHDLRKLGEPTSIVSHLQENKVFDPTEIFFLVSFVFFIQIIHTLFFHFSEKKCDKSGLTKSAPLVAPLELK